MESKNYNSLPETQEILEQIAVFQKEIQYGLENKEAKTIDFKQFILLLSGISTCRKTPGILEHMGYEKLYFCTEKECEKTIQHLEKLCSITDKKSLIRVCIRRYSTEEEYQQFLSFWNEKPVFDIGKLHPQALEFFEKCKEYAGLFRHFVKDKGFFAWDCNEKIGLCRKACACGMITEKEFYELTENMALKAARQFSSWEEYAISCLCGGVYFMFKENEANTENLKGFFDINLCLLKNLLSKEGPWKQYKWFCFEKKKWAIAEKEMKNLLTVWEGPKECFATDRIVVDGCEIGYMYREKPSDDNAVFDSGWRFFAGDESEEYLNDANHIEIYHLNILCNYDEQIIPLLHAPYGKAYIRNEKGVFCLEQFPPVE